MASQPVARFVFILVTYHFHTRCLTSSGSRLSSLVRMRGSRWCFFSSFFGVQERHGWQLWRPNSFTLFQYRSSRCKNGITVAGAESFFLFFIVSSSRKGTFDNTKPVTVESILADSMHMTPVLQVRQFVTNSLSNQIRPLMTLAQKGWHLVPQQDRVCCHITKKLPGNSPGSNSKAKIIASVIFFKLCFLVFSENLLK